MPTELRKPKIDIGCSIAVVVVLLLLFAAIWPLFQRNHSGITRQEVCISNLRQLSQAVMMYANDHPTHQMPDANWMPEILPYIRGGNQPTDTEMFTCRSIGRTTLPHPICYGYNAALLTPDGKGISDSQVIHPTEVGVLCDAAPVREFSQGGGLIGERAAPTHRVTPAGRHLGGVVVAYVDGHARLIPGYDPRNSNDDVLRAFGALR